MAVDGLDSEDRKIVEVVERIGMNVLLIMLNTAFIAAVALAVAALGARTAQVRAIFLVEGAFIGLVGGGLGLLLAWLVSFPGDRLARSIMQAQAPRPVEGSLFVF